MIEKKAPSENMKDRWKETLYGINTIFSPLDTNSGKRKIFEIILNSGKLNSQAQEMSYQSKTKEYPIRELESKIYVFTADRFYRKKRSTQWSYCSCFKLQF
jgi:hypothetical protein